MTSASTAMPQRMVEELAHFVGDSISEIVPTEAQLHFLRAQQELLLGLAAIVEHNRGRGQRVARAAKTAANRAASSTRKRASTKAKSSAQRTSSKGTASAKPSSRRPRKIHLA